MRASIPSFILYFYDDSIISIKEWINIILQTSFLPPPPPPPSSIYNLLAASPWTIFAL